MITLDGTNGITTPDVDTDGLTVDTNTLFVDAANNRVGVGTSSPDGTLNVSGLLRVGTANTGPESYLDVYLRDGGTAPAAAVINMRSSASNNETIPVSQPNLVLRRGSATRGSLLEFSNGSAGFSGIGSNATSDNNHDLRIFTGDGSERARIDGSGRLLVNTTSPSEDATVTIQGFGSNNRSLSCVSAVTTFTRHISFVNPNGLVGGISTSGTATSYTTSSDYRLKEDVQPMVGSVDRLMALKPVNFAWKADGSRVDGFLAHEAQEVVPEAVTGEKDEVDDEGNPQYQGIDQSKLSPLLVAALQEALTKIEALEARVAALETNA
jgi:hypothetical protein